MPSSQRLSLPVETRLFQTLWVRRTASISLSRPRPVSAETGTAWRPRTCGKSRSVFSRSSASTCWGLSIRSHLLKATTGALPSLIYIWENASERAFHERTAAAILVVLAFMLVMNAAAVLLRRRFERRW